MADGPDLDLSPERRALLELLLRERGLEQPAAARIERRPRGGRAPASFAQERLWFLDQVDAGRAAYHVAGGVRLHGALDVSALERALTEIVRRHEALRTRLVHEDGRPCQEVVPAEDVALVLERVELERLPEEEREREARLLAGEEVRKPFDLARDPKLRTLLVRLAPEDHVLVVCMHHIASDGWSLGIFVDELASLYEAFRDGRPSPLEELPIQYADYAVWQREHLRGEALERELAHWRGRLARTPVLELPGDRPRPAVQSHRGGRVKSVFPPRLAEDLRALARREDATLFMVLLAAFQALLCRYSGEEDVAVGSPVAGRGRPELGGLIGFFVNTLVLRTDLSGDPTFRELVRRARQVCIDAYEHQDMPFEKLVEELKPERSLSHSPLFQVMLVLQNAPRRRRSLADLAIAPLDEVETGASMFDLTLYVGETDTRLAARLEYASDLFERETAERLLGHLERLLEAVAADPDLRLSELPLLADEERDRLLRVVNETAAELPEATLHGLFAAQAARTPDAVALRFEGDELTYAELERRSNRLARALRGRGGGPETVVGVALERSPALVVTLLAVLKAGGAYLPLDPAYPRERLAFMLEDARPAFTLTREGLVERLPAVSLLVLEREREVLAAGTAEPLEEATGPDSLAYVLYTSGSTGEPKGVLAPHRGAVNRLAWMWRAFPFGPEEVACQRTSLSFVDHVWELFGPLLAGVPLVILPDATVLDPERLLDALAERRVTRLVVVPSLLRTLVEVCPDLGARLPDLGLVASSGEELPADLAERFLDAAPRARLLNLYGCSEAAGDSTCHEVERGRSRGRVPIGRPIANTQVYVVDRLPNPVPAGVAGELLIGGAGLARGYLNRPDLTAERFVRNPFSADPESRLYRTGDLARYRGDGAIELLGRADAQVKVRGFRIELGEIEAALVSHPAVREAACSVHEAEPGDRRLVAYVVPADGAGAPDASELRDHLRERLPDFMLPAAFVPLPALPLTPSRKVDRRALPAPDWETAGARRAYEAPANELEAVIAEIWKDLIGVERVGAYDNFFDRGGHSLLAVQAVDRLERRVGVRMNPGAMVNQTLRQLAAACEARGGAVPEPPRQGLLGRITGRR